MPNTTDLIIILSFIYFFLTGWQKGFLKTLAGPISLILGWTCAYFYYLESHQLIIALAAAIILPALLKFLISTLLKLIIHPKKDDKENQVPQTLGQLAGGFLNIFWSGSIFVLTVISITMIPFPLPYINAMREDILKSHTYKLAEPYLPKELPKNGADIQKAMATLKNPEQLQTLQKSDEYKNLHNDPKIKELLADEDISKMIAEKNFVQLLSNPKIQEIFQDKELIQKILRFNQKLIESSQNPPTEKK